MSIRRSGRERKANPRYSQDTLDDADLEGFVLPAEDSDASSFEHTALEDEEDDDEDDDNIVLEASEDDAEVENSGYALDEITEGETPTKRAARIVLSQEDLTLDDNDQELQQALPRHKQGGKRAVFNQEGYRNRGVLFTTSVMSRDTTLREIAGYDEKVFEMMRNERNKFSGSITLPRREALGPGQSGMDYPEVQSGEVRERERQKFRHWYIDNKGWEIMAKAQSTSSLPLVESEKYNLTKLSPQNVLLGPYNAQTMYSIGCGTSISLKDAWTFESNAEGRVSSKLYDEIWMDS